MRFLWQSVSVSHLVRAEGCLTLFGQQSKLPEPKTKGTIISRRDQLEDGKRSRQAFGEFQKEEWGDYYVDGIRLVFKPHNEFRFVVSLYSSVNSDGLWFYGIQRSDWASWTTRNYLVFLMKDADGVNSALLDPQESKRLLDLHESNSIGDKKIHIRRPRNMGKLYFVKWPDYPLAAKLRRLEL